MRVWLDGRMKSPLDWKISPPASPFGSLAISRETHGVASSDYSEFAFIGRRFSVVEEKKATWIPRDRQ